MKPEQLDRVDVRRSSLDDTKPKTGEQPYPPQTIHGVRDALNQLRDVVATLDSDTYSNDEASTIAGSVGAHVRHCLDHIEPLVNGTTAGIIDYDHRERGTAIETDPAAAVGLIDRICDDLLSLPADINDQPVQVRVMLASDGDTACLRSTIGRELAFVLSHTIHHAAMIRSIVCALDHELPEGFGLAPSTIAYRNS